MGRRILVVEDDPKTVALLQRYLERDGYEVVTAADGHEALLLLRHREPDLVLLDLMLPGLDGLDLCHALRQVSATPVIMLTARVTEEDRLTGLDVGADDYITKPFSPREVVARVRAVLRRASGAAPGQSPTVVGDLKIDHARREVRLGGELVHLTATEFRLLAILAREPGRVFTRQELIERAFDFEYDGLERTVDVHVRNLRRKVERDAANPRSIQTVYGVGYRLGP